MDKVFLAIIGFFALALVGVILMGVLSARDPAGQCSTMITEAHVRVHAGRWPGVVKVTSLPDGSYRLGMDDGTDVVMPSLGAALADCDTVGDPALCRSVERSNYRELAEMATWRQFR